MPEVIFTPRVSVRRMCTPSRISLAASVRRISSMISSCDGISANASARADSRSRSRCSLEPEDAAVVQPQPFPHGVAALHRRVERADARLVAVHEPAVDVDDQVAVALVELAAARPRASGCQPVRRRALVAGAGMRLERVKLPAAACGSVSRRDGSKPVDFSTPAYQCLRPDAVGRLAARAARRASRSANATPSASQSAPQHAARVREHVAGVDDRRRAPGRAEHALEDLDLLRQAGVGERRVPRASWPSDASISRGSRIRKALVTRDEPVALDLRQQVVRHVLLVEDRASPGAGAEQHRDDLPPVALPERDDLARARGALDPVLLR